MEPNAHAVRLPPACGRPPSRLLLRPAAPPSLQSYSLVCGSTLTLHSATGEAGTIARLAHARRITALMPQQQDNAMLLGLEDGSLQVRGGGKDPSLGSPEACGATCQGAQGGWKVCACPRKQGVGWGGVGWGGVGWGGGGGSG